MPQVKLTATSVERFAPPELGRVEYFDQALPGFGLRITDKGHKSWIVFYRVGQRQRRLTIGPYPLFSLAEAREEARLAMQLVAKGLDPAEERAEAKRSLNSPNTVTAVLDRFIQNYARPKNRTWRETQRMFETNVLPLIGRRDIKSITRRDIRDILDKVSARTSPLRANRVLAGVRKFFNWAMDQDIIEASPAHGVKPPGVEKERERVLDDEEIRKVWNACDEMGWPFGPFTQMLLVTAQRRNELAHMKWDDLDLDKRIWTIPREDTKADRSHEVPLSDLAISIISEMPKIGPFVFMSGMRESSPISGFSKAKKRLDKLSDVNDWRYHDLRRTAGTNMARLGVPVSTISRVLNHAEGGVTRIYARHSYLNEKREALQMWSASLAKKVDIFL